MNRRDLARVWRRLKGVVPSDHEALTAEELPIHSADLKVFASINSSAHLALAFTPASKDIGRLSKIKLQGLGFSSRELVLNRKKTDRYLIIECTIPWTSVGSSPFTKYCEDVLDHLDSTNCSAIESTYIVSMRWKHFWAEGAGQVFTKAWLAGIFGELSFLRSIASLSPGNSLASWAGPDGRDQDFQLNGIGCEVKTTTSSSMVFLISNLNQLDDSCFSSLWLVTYRLEESLQGESIVSLVRGIEKKLGIDDQYLEIFYRKLKRAGYSLNEEVQYEQHKYRVVALDWYPVNEDFPRIVSKSLALPLSPRIISLKYSIDVSSLESVAPEGVVEKMLAN